MSENKNKNRSCCYSNKEKVEEKIEKDRTCRICNCFCKISAKKEEENRKNLEDYLKKINKEIKDNKDNKINNPPGGINFE